MAHTQHASRPLFAPAALWITWRPLLPPTPLLTAIAGRPGGSAVTPRRTATERPAGSAKVMLTAAMRWTSSPQLPGPGSAMSCHAVFDAVAGADHTAPLRGRRQGWGCGPSTTTDSCEGGALAGGTRSNRSALATQWPRTQGRRCNACPAAAARRHRREPSSLQRRRRRQKRRRRRRYRPLWPTLPEVLIHVRGEEERNRWRPHPVMVMVVVAGVVGEWEGVVHGQRLCCLAGWQEDGSDGGEV